MGNAAVAFPSSQSIFFYNPAHVLYLPAGPGPLIMVGLNGSFSNNFGDQLDFYNQRLQPALEEGLDNLSEQEVQALYIDAVNLGSQRTFAGGDLLLPSFGLNRGRYGFGGGLFVTSELRYKVDDTEQGAPSIDFVSQADVMALAVGALNLSESGFPGLSVGVTGKYTQRYVMLKNKQIDQLDAQEDLYVLGGAAFNFDAGLHYRLHTKPLGDFHLGAVLYDVLGNQFSYGYKGYYDKNAPEKDEITIEAELTQATERLPLHRTYRVGAAYTTPTMKGPIRSLGFAVDYIGNPLLRTSNATSDHVRLGMQVDLSRTLALRGGMNRGKPTLGAGLQLASFISVDYAYHYVQERSLPHGWNHTLQVTLGSF